VFVVLLFFLDKLDGFKFMLAHISAFLYKSQVYLKDIDILISQPTQARLAKNESSIHLSQDSDIEMHNITYQYPTSKNPLFHNQTFVFPKHQLTAIQGPSGCGKSTLAKLAIGLIDNQKGHIFLQQQDITNDSSKRQSYIAYLPQSVKLFDGNILDNIRYTCQHQYSKSQIDKWIRKYHLHNILMKDPNNHDYLERDVGLSGNKLSGGQRQLVVLLRTFITNECRKIPKKIFILDEPTSALDKHTGQMVLDWLKLLTKQYTIIIITHDPKIAKQCSHHILI
jgi:ABC-type bacteriocin/lantibiotic exporter with double-glycine peptidase domain